MKKYIFVLIFGFALYSCEKEQDNEPPVYNNLIPRVIHVEFVNHARLKSAFELVNSFHLDISSLYSSLYVSKFPADSIDYIVEQLNAKPYLMSGGFKVQKGGEVYIDSETGKITVICLMFGMDETRQTDWAITTSVLGLEEQPSPKEFYLRVPEGQEVYWRNKFRLENIVNRADLISAFYNN